MLTKFEIKEGDEYLSSHSGLALVGALLNRTNLGDRLSNETLPNCKEPKISHRDVIYSMIGLICLGKPDFDAIEPFRKHPFFAQSLGIADCPSSSTLRQRFEMIEDRFEKILKEESADLICNTALEVTTISTEHNTFVPLDIDVSPFDNSKTQKEGVSRTYKGFDGFAPIFAYVGQEGYLANLELREGKQHCQKNTPEFLQASIEYSQMITDKNLLIRMDSGNDSMDNIKICIQKNVDWIIKRNLRKEQVLDWLQIAKEQGNSYSPRPGKTVWIGSIERNIEDFEQPLRMVFKVVERTIIKGQPLLFPEIEVETYWTSLLDDPSKIIQYYHDHGTSEQFHSELKTDMNLERLPSERFSINALILLLGMLGYNLLRLCGQESLREDNGTIEKRPTYRRKASRRRILTVIQDLIYLASRITTRSRKLFLSFGRYCPWVEVWRVLYSRFMIPDTS